MTNSPLVLVNFAWKRSGAFAVNLEGSSRSGWTVDASGPEGLAAGGGVAGAAAVVAAAVVVAPLVETGSSFLAHAVSASPARKR